MIEADGTFRYVVPTDARALVELGIWLKARLYPVLGVAGLVAVLVMAFGFWVHSALVVVLGAVVLLEYPLVIVRGVRRLRRRCEERFGQAWGAAFGPGGVRVDGALLSTTYAWAYFAAWTIHRGQLVLVHSGMAAVFVAVPIEVVPEDEWQPLTTLMYERLGPARQPESVRGSRLRSAPSRKSGESAAVRP